MSLHVVLCPSNFGAHSSGSFISASNAVALSNHVNMRRKQIHRGFKMECTSQIACFDGFPDWLWRNVQRLLNTCKNDVVVLYVYEHVGMPKEFFALNIAPQKVMRVLPNGSRVEIENGVIPRAVDRISKREYEPYLKTLGLSLGTTVEDVKKQYKKLVLLHHPDKQGDREMFVQITAAYKVLVPP